MHVSVMAEEAVEGLNVQQDGIYVDGTLGAGGHSLRILDKLGPGGLLLSMDRDAGAVAAFQRREKAGKGPSIAVQGSFMAMKQVLTERRIAAVDGILLDLGISSDQLDDPTRGFSFNADGPLDMRMDCSCGRTAADLVNDLPEKELADLFFHYGEERASRRIAKAIIDARREGPITRTLELAGLVERVKGGRRSRIHPATQVFMALRIAVNDELGALEQGLEAGLQLLAVHGRMAVISFHSLEDRIVKQQFSDHVGVSRSLQQGGERWEGVLPRLKWIQKKPRVPGGDECKQNPRARSAKLRVVERIASNE